ncbi:hypothetical protein PSTG_04408 [Puccinia striiformis f. sp. tritici PST-78]|uniref:Uncharacterized protein n=1 Tax=Puccinia striiformis f. sp. tritici PST-78 TaxID=1165861 RepID=A0A0L0VTA4_9BASI|nr:hypothetical protein PSTG_04408 [Puccinia striiformis f. sp. tritici PST-78]
MDSSLSASPSSYPQQYNGASNYSPQWGNYNNNDNNNNGYQNGYQPSSRGGYNYPPQGNNMRQAIMRDQEQRRLQYQQQMQQQQRRPEMNNQNPGPEGQPETTAGQTHQAAIEPASESDNPPTSFSGAPPASHDAGMKNISPTEMKAANIKSADFTKTADLQAQPSHLPGGQQNPCAPGTDSSSWGHPVWWGWSETSPCGQ